MDQQEENFQILSSFHLTLEKRYRVHQGKRLVYEYRAYIRKVAATYRQETTIKRANFKELKDAILMYLKRIREN